jgi:hypothetical protein
MIDGTRRSNIAQQAASVVMGPGLRRDDGEFVARPANPAWIA